MNEIVYTQAGVEYPKGYWTGAVSVTKVRNAMRKAGFELVNAKNDSVNRVRCGMSGFVRHRDGRLVYVSQDCSGFGESRFLYRAARHDKDWTGGQNHYCRPEQLVEAVQGMFALSTAETWDRHFA